MTPQRFQAIFHGSDIAHGHSELTGKVNARGKAEVRCWTLREKAVESHFTAHMSGVRSLGLPPINSESMCRWGAIDVDEYGVDHTELIRHIYENDMPLVPFRTKSGGLHLYIFLTEWVPAAWMITTLSAVSSGLGLSRCEIFPKQSSISTEEGSFDVGNWINLPYFGDTRRCIRADNTEMTLDEFDTHVTTRLFTQKQIEESTLRPADELFPDGPPCLNAIFGRKADPNNRNVALSNLATYLKKADPASWRERLHELNRTTYAEPLGRDEVEATIIKSHSRKDYRYQCSQEPLCRFCDSSACVLRKHGISPGAGSVETMGSNRSLTKVETDPVTWYLDITSSDGTVKRMRLSTEELQNPMLFQRRTMEVMHEMMIPPKRDEWTAIVSNLMKHVNIVHVPRSATLQGMFEDTMHQWLAGRAGDDRDVLLNGRPWRDGDTVKFSFAALMQHIGDKRTLSRVTHREATLWAQEYGAATCGFLNVRGKGMNLWAMNMPAEKPVTLPIPTDEQTDPF